MLLPFGEGHLLTNPVWSIEQILLLLDYDHAWDASADRLAHVVQLLQDRGVAVPAWWIEDLESRRLLPAGSISSTCEATPRVVGLFVDLKGPHGFVVPLEVTEGERWSCSLLLPFSVSDVQDAMQRLLAQSGLPLAGRVPERWSFRVEERFGERIHGSSMTLAALLAVIDAAGGKRCPLLERACVAVESDGSAQLRSTELVELKLAAFVREYRRGSLLVRHTTCPARDKFDTYFDHVWIVGSQEALCAELDNSGLLGPLLRKIPLSRRELAQVTERLCHLEQVAHRYQDALELARRLNFCEFTDEVAEWQRQGPLEVLGNLQRHLGQFPAAIATSGRVLAERERAGEGTSYDELARATIHHGAALFDGHQFREAGELLLPWLERIEQDRQLLHPATRIALWNTLGRIRAVLGDSNWELPFRQSLELQQRHDRPGLARTWNYLLLSMLRNGRRNEARQALEADIPIVADDDFSRWIAGYIQAELARQEGRVWQDPDMESGKRPRGVPGHPWGFYFQATARQPGRADAENRFARAAEYFFGEDERGGGLTILQFYADGMRLAAAGVSGDSARWQAAREQLKAFVGRPSAEPVGRYYGDVLARLESGPSLELAEALCDKLPFL